MGRGQPAPARAIGRRGTVQRREAQFSGGGRRAPRASCSISTRAPADGQKRRYGVAGHSFVSVVEFSPEVHARSVLVFGENSDPALPHDLDQTRLYANQEFKPAWFPRKDIAAHAERKYHPGE